MGLSETESRSWEELLSRAYFAADDGALERLSKGKESVRRKIDKMREMRIAPLFYDYDRVKRVLLEYSRTYKYKESVKACMGYPDEMLTAFDMEPEAKMVMGYIKERIKQNRELENGEMLDEAREAASDILREGDEGKRTKMASFMLERLDRKSFGEDAGGGDESSGGVSRTVYRVSNVNIGTLTLNGGSGGNGMSLDLRMESLDKAAAVEAEVVGEEKVEKPVKLPIGIA